MIDTQQYLVQMQDVFDIEERSLSLDDKFREQPEWSSLTYLSIIAMVHDEYGVALSSVDFRQLQTFGDILRVISERIP